MTWGLIIIAVILFIGFAEILKTLQKGKIPAIREGERTWTAKREIKDIIFHDSHVLTGTDRLKIEIIKLRAWASGIPGMFIKFNHPVIFYPSWLKMEKEPSRKYVPLIVTSAEELQHAADILNEDRKIKMTLNNKEYICSFARRAYQTSNGCCWFCGTVEIYSNDENVLGLIGELDLSSIDILFQAGALNITGFKGGQWIDDFRKLNQGIESLKQKFDEKVLDSINEKHSKKIKELKDNFGI